MLQETWHCRGTHLSRERHDQSPPRTAPELNLSFPASALARNQLAVSFASETLPTTWGSLAAMSQTFEPRWRTCSHHTAMTDRSSQVTFAGSVTFCKPHTQPCRQQSLHHDRRAKSAAQTRSAFLQCAVCAWGHTIAALVYAETRRMGFNSTPFL